MKDKAKLKGQLIDEIANLHQQVAELETLNNQHKVVRGDLAKGEGRETSILDSLIEHVVYVDTEMRIVWPNLAACKSVDLSREELIGRHCYEIWPKRKNPCPDCPVIKAMQTGNPQKVEKTTPDGRPWLIKGFPVKDSEGKVIGAVETTLEITKRKRAEEALRKSEERFKDISFSMADWIWEVDKDGKYTFASGKAKQILGYAPKEIIGKTPFELMPEDEAKRVGRIFKKISLEKKPIVDLENWNLTKQGKKVCLLTNGVPILDEKGNLLGYRGVDKDITEHKKMEEALRESEERFRTIFETAQDSIFIKDQNLRYIQVNPAMERLFGLPASQLIGLKDEDLFGEEAGAHIKEVDLHILKGKIVEEEHTKPVKGNSLTFHIVKVPIRDSSGGIIGLCGIARDITDRKQTEEALRVEKAYLEQLFKSSPEAIAVVDNDSRVLRANNEFTRMFGYTLDEALGRSIDELLVPEDLREEAFSLTKRVIRGEGVTLESIRQRKDGSLVDVSILGAPIKVGGGQAAVYAIYRDITERKKAEEALQRRSFQQGQLLETARHLTASLNVKEVLSRIGTGAKKILKAQGCALYFLEEDGKTLTPVIAIDPRYQKEILSTPLNVETSFTGQAVKNRRGLVFNDAETNPSGQRIPGTPEEKDERIIVAPFVAENKILGAMCLDRIGTPFSEEDLALAETFATYAATALKNAQTYDELQHEVEERRRTEQALRESEKRFRDLFESSPDAIFVEDFNGNLLDVNPAACRLHGIERGSLIGKNASELVPPDRREEAARNLVKLAQGKRMESLSLTGEGRAVPVEIRGSHIEYSGKPAVLLHVHDISERKQAEEEKERLEEQLRQAQKMEAVGTLAGGIAHDFNNLLGGILGYSSLLLSKFPPDDPNRKYVELMERAGTRAAELTNRLLGFARQGKYEDKPVDINHLISGVVELLSASLDKRIEIKTELCEENPPTKGDQNQLEQVLMNLCVNARDAMPNGGELSISSRLVHLGKRFVSEHLGAIQGDYVCITVSDTGLGMDEETKAKIFDPFFTTKGQGEGTGLGLSMVYGIVKNHGGYLSVYSEVGKGTTFEIYLPLSQGLPIRPERKEEKASLGSESILVVDDEEILRNLMKDILENLGYGVMLASDGQEAVDFYREHQAKIDLVIVDMMMPKMGGRETFQELKRINPKVKALLASGYSKNTVAQRILDLGVKDFLHKPFSLEEISNKVRETLDAE